MKNQLSNQEREFFFRLKGGNLKIRIAVIAFIALLFFGLLIDGFVGFYVLRNAKSMFWGIVGLLILSLFYLIGEAISEWINSKDKVSQPLYKRAFHLLILLCFAGGVMVACWFIFKWLGW